MAQNDNSKPLAGLQVLEIAGIGPVPHLGTILRNLGASVTVITRLEPGPYDFLHSFYAQGKEHLALDLKEAAAQAEVLELARSAAVLVEGMRPGVMERLGLGPDAVHKVNSELIYARVTGYGQDGPLSQDPGHDINYIAQSGALYAFRQGNEMPVPPLNVVGDFAGGAMHGALSILAALWGIKSGNSVQRVLDIAMVDGSAALLTMAGNFAAVLGAGVPDPLANAPFYGVYESAESGEYVAIGALEPQFFSRLLGATGIDFPDDDSQSNPATWPELREKFTAVFRTKSRAEWARIGHATGSCLSAVWSLEESVNDPHMSHRIEQQRMLGPVGGALHPSLYR